MITLKEVQQAYREAYVANESRNLLEVSNAIKAAASQGLPSVSICSTKLNSAVVKILVQQGFKVLHDRGSRTVVISWAIY